MARPNILTYKGDGTLQVMSQSEFEALADRVLEHFADTTGAGSIYDSDGGVPYATVGTFTDTRYQDSAGGSDITILSTDYTLYQNLDSDFGSVSAHPMVWDYVSSEMRVATSSQVTDLGDAILSHLVNQEAPGSYRIAESTPANGTWQNIYTINNYDNVGQPTVYYLYKKIAGETTFSYSPLKNNGGGELINFSIGEVTSLAEKVREQIIATGIGQYKLQDEAPATGSWTNVGTLIDTRPNIVSTYSGSTAYTGDDAAVYTGDQVDATYTGAGDNAYTTLVDGVTTDTYTGIVPINYEGVQTFYIGTTTSYTKTRVASSDPYSYPVYITGDDVQGNPRYLGSYDGTEGGNIVEFEGVSYIGPATPKSYSSVPVYEGGGSVDYVGLLDSDYIGPGELDYQANSVVNYAGSGDVTYTSDGANDEPYTRAETDVSNSYVGPNTSYIGPGSGSYTSNYQRIRGYQTYIGPPPGIYYYGPGTNEITYVGPIYVGPPTPTGYVGATYSSLNPFQDVDYLGVGEYVGTSDVDYASIAQVDYLGPADFLAEFADALAEFDASPAELYEGTINYTGVDLLDYVGPAAQIDYVATENLYDTAYTGSVDAVYSTAYTATFDSVSDYQGADIGYHLALGPYWGQQRYFGPGGTYGGIPYPGNPLGYFGFNTNIYYLSPGVYTGGSTSDVDYVTDYTGSVDTDYTTTYDGSIAYTGDQLVDVSYGNIVFADYIGPTVFNAYEVTYSGEGYEGIAYQGAQYVGAYQGVANAANYVRNYSRNYQGVSPTGPVAYYLRTYTRVYTGPASYVADLYTSTFSAPYDTAYSSEFADPVYEGGVEYLTTGIFATYESLYVASSFDAGDGINYTGPLFLEYIGAGEEINYVRTYTRIQYETWAGYVGTYISNYTRNYLGQARYQLNIYASGIDYIGGEYTTIYDASFVGPSYQGPVDSTEYIRAIPAAISYTGLGFAAVDYAALIDYQKSYIGSVIGSDPATISTLTLWKRIG